MKSPGQAKQTLVKHYKFGFGDGGGGGEAQAVEQAVPIGTKLQLRATIGADSGV